MKSGANQQLNAKYYPIETHNSVVVDEVKVPECLLISPGMYSMMKIKVKRNFPCPNHSGLL